MKFSPSAASRWLTCPGSVRLSEGIVVPPSEYAVEGTGAHQLLEYSQRLDMPPTAFVGQVLETKDGEVAVTSEMADAVTVFLDEISMLPVESSMIEQRLESTEIAGLAGTADYVNLVGRTLHLYDYKHGAGVSVSVEGNQQLLTYAGLALERWDADEVVLKIVQPRAHGCAEDDVPKVRQWTVTREQVGEHMAAVAEATSVARRDDAPLVPGDHCRWCPAKPQCPRLHQLAVSEAKADFRLPSPVELSGERLVWWLDFAPVLEDWLKSIREFAKRELEAGREVPGWKVVESVGNRRWNGDEESIGRSLVAQGFHPDDIFEPRTLKGPAQVEKCPPNGMKVKEAKELVSELTFRPVTGTSLVREGDRRPAIKNTAANDFTRIEQK